MQHFRKVRNLNRLAVENLIRKVMKPQIPLSHFLPSSPITQHREEGQKSHACELLLSPS